MFTENGPSVAYIQISNILYTYIQIALNLTPNEQI